MLFILAVGVVWLALCLLLVAICAVAKQGERATTTAAPTRAAWAARDDPAHAGSRQRWA